MRCLAKYNTTEPDLAEAKKRLAVSIGVWFTLSYMFGEQLGEGLVLTSTDYTDKMRGLFTVDAQGWETAMQTT